MDALDIFQSAVFEDGITKNEFITYHPLSTQYSNNAEIRFLIQNQQVLAKISDSYLCIEGKVNNLKDNETFKFVNNPFLFLFQEIRFLLNEHVISSIREPGLLSLVRGLLTLNAEKCRSLSTAGFNTTSLLPVYNNTTKVFHAILPLKFIFPLFEDYQKVILYLRQELVLIRGRDDSNSYIGAAGLNLDINKITWRVPHISINNDTQLKLLREIKSEQRLIDIPFRQWGLHILPEVQQTRHVSWRVTNFPRFQRPRYIILAFQSDRRDDPKKDNGLFDHCTLTSVKAYLNDTCFPYETFDTDFSQGNWIHFYNNYALFQEQYLGKNHSKPYLSYDDFKTHPFFIINCREQDTPLTSTMYDLKIEIECSTNLANNTYIYAIVVSDNLIQYNPISETLIKTIE